MGLPILTFHAIDDKPSPISFPPALFQEALGRLHTRGFRTLDLCSAIGYLRRGEPFPPLCFAITLDDGYQSVHTEALPTLARYGMTATVFITTGEQLSQSLDERLPGVLGRRMLSWREVREIQCAGMTIGAHTLTHPDLTRQCEAEIERQLVGSRSLIEDALGTPVRAFSYPLGRYDRRVRDAASRHFILACTDRLGLAGGESDPWALSRVDAYYLRSPFWLDRIGSPAFPWYLRARNTPRQIRRALWPAA